MRTVSALAVILLILLIASAGAAPSTGPTTQPAPISKSDIDRLFQPLIDHQYCPGLVVGIVTPAGRQVYGYGRARDDAAGPPNGATVYEIGSVSKVFTGLLLAEAVRRKEVAFDDPVKKYLPDGISAPQRGDKPFTLVQLSTHRSGLPRMPANFSPKDPANPYADYTVQQMYEFLNRCKPAREPEGGYEYSNLGVGLLGHLLAVQAGVDYEGLMVRRIAGPLEMKDTRVTLSPAQLARLATPHDGDGEPASNWDIPTLAGAGAIRSTADDLLTFLSAQTGITRAPGGLAESIRISQQRQAEITPAAGDKAGMDIALGWHLNRGSQLYWHNGQTGGYHSFVAFHPQKQYGVVVLTNAGGWTEAPAAALLRRLAGKMDEPFPLPPVAKVEPATLDRYVGTYVMGVGALGGVITISRDGEKLYAQVIGQPRLRIWPESDRRFNYRAVAAVIEFPDSEGKPAKLLLKQNGKEIAALRIQPQTQPAGN